MTEAKLGRGLVTTTNGGGFLGARSLDGTITCNASDVTEGRKRGRQRSNSRARASEPFSDVAPAPVPSALHRTVARGPQLLLETIDFESMTGYKTLLRITGAR